MKINSKFVIALLCTYLKRSGSMSRLLNCKPNWKLSNVDRVIAKKLQFYGQLRCYSLKSNICIAITRWISKCFQFLLSEKKKSSSLNGWAIKEKIFFFWTFIFILLLLFQRSLSSGGGGEGGRTNGPAIKRRTFFCGFPLAEKIFFFFLANFFF